MGLVGFVVKGVIFDKDNFWLMRFRFGWLGVEIKC